MKTFASTLLFSLVVACGGGSSKPATETAAPDPVPMQEGSATAPAEPAETATAPTPAPPEPPPPDPKAELLAAETAAYEKAKPVFDKWCAGCHTKGGRKANAKKLGEFDMTTYPFGGEHANEIGEEVREVLGLAGKKPSMPPDKKGAVKGEELEAIKAWSEAFDASHAGGAHAGHQGH